MAHGIIRKTLLTGIFASFLVAPIFSGMAEAAKLKGSGPINWVSYATAYSPVTRNNTIWDAVPGLRLKTKKTRARLVITLSAAVDSRGGTGYCYVMALVDGVAAEPRTLYYFHSFDQQRIGQRSFTWIFEGGPGKLERVVKIRWATDAGFTCWMGERSLTVQYQYN